MNPLGSSLCALVVVIFLAGNVFAGDDRPVTLNEEEGKPVEEDTPPIAVPQAENVDLKEVISEPLHEALPISPVPDGNEDSAESSVKESAPEIETTEPQEQAPKEQLQPLLLLGTEVLPGTATRIAWAVNNSLAGIFVPTPVLVVHGEKPGPTVCLTGAIHGDELNGIEVVRKVMYDLDPKKLTGSVIGVPIVNVQGFRRASRYLPDRRDLNRYFPGTADGSSAARIAHSFFSQIVQHCNYLIDLHTGSFRRTNLPQLRADLSHDHVTEMTRNMGDIVVLHSSGAPGSLRREAVQAGVTAVTIEAGEPLHIDLESVRKAASSIETFLDKMGMYRKKGSWARQTEPVYYTSRWVRASTGGILLSDIRLGARVSKGQTLGEVTDPITNVATPIKSPIDGQVIGMALNQVMLPGYAAYHIGFQASVEEAASEDVGPDDSAGDDAGVSDTLPQDLDQEDR